MAKARRATAARSSGRKKGRGVLWLIVGLLLGAALMYGAQLYLYKGSKPFTGLAGLFDAGKKQVEKKAEPRPEPQAERPPKPRLDFYTILPEYETVLPDPKPSKKTAKVEPPETSASYVYVLQAASYAHLEDADRLKAKLALNGFEANIEKISIQGKGEYFRVRLGPYPTVEALDAVSARLAQLGIKAMRIKIKKSAAG